MPGLLVFLLPRNRVISTFISLAPLPPPHIHTHTYSIVSSVIQGDWSSKVSYLQGKQETHDLISWICASGLNAWSYLFLKLHWEPELACLPSLGMFRWGCGLPGFTADSRASYWKDYVMPRSSVAICMCEMSLCKEKNLFWKRFIYLPNEVRSCVKPKL